MFNKNAKGMPNSYEWICICDFYVILLNKRGKHLQKLPYGYQFPDILATICFDLLLESVHF